VGSGAGLDGVGLLATEEGGAIVLVRLRVATRDGEGSIGQRRASGVAGAPRARHGVQEVAQVVRVRAGDVETNVEVAGLEALGDAAEA
jgi:hypothetical protein